MCDYSLRDVASRPAKVGDKLVSTQFPNPIRAASADPSQPRVAVCLMLWDRACVRKRGQMRCLVPFLAHPENQHTRSPAFARSI